MPAPQFRYSKMNLRYELSAKGHAAQISKGPGRIVGESRDKTCWQVIPDGNKYPYSIHKSFIRIIDPQ